jgi:hypothetical protein
MAVVQNSYSETHRKAVAGMVANMTNYDADTCIVETAAGIGFGLACGQGSADNGAVLGATAAADFRGISVRDITLAPEDADKYQEDANIALLTEGDIWVTTGGVVEAGDDVTFVATTGVLSSAATSGSQFAIVGARWMTSAGSGELAVVRLSGHVPAA